MTREERKELDDLREAIHFLNARLTDFFLRAESLRELLQKYGVFPGDEYAAKLAESRALWLSRLDQDIEKRRDDEQERLRQLLESFEGTKQ